MLISTRGLRGVTFSCPPCLNTKYTMTGCGKQKRNSIFQKLHPPYSRKKCGFDFLYNQTASEVAAYKKAYHSIPFKLKISCA